MEVSIIVPMYNEEKRAPLFLKRLTKFLKKNLRSYEIIFVNDGSSDRTLTMCEAFKAQDAKRIKIISYAKNQGKGFAVKTGVLNAKGNKIIFIDADGSISPDEIILMIKKLDTYDVVVGSRTSKESKIKQHIVRKLTGVSFNFYVSLLYKINVNDTLCGFKGFKKEIARDLFKDLIDKRWIFDVEIFYKIRKKKYTMYRQPIKWEHKGESKIKLIDPFKMMLELLAVRIKLAKKNRKIFK